MLGSVNNALTATPQTASSPSPIHRKTRPPYLPTPSAINRMPAYAIQLVWLKRGGQNNSWQTSTLAVMASDAMGEYRTSAIARARPIAIATPYGLVTKVSVRDTTSDENPDDVAEADIDIQATRNATEITGSIAARSTVRQVMRSQ
jgi:hypothetical protein